MKIIMSRYSREFRAFPEVIVSGVAVGKTEQKLSTLREAHEDVFSQVVYRHYVHQTKPQTSGYSFKHFRTLFMFLPCCSAIYL